MLQQTQVKTVIPYYERFMALFPTIFDLAQADQERVLKAWEGLGYYSRAKNLQKAAQEICAVYQGRMPGELSKLLNLPGIGPYTAGAVLSIAFGAPVPAIDGNVHRVISRFLALDEDITKQKTKKTIEACVMALISQAPRPDQFTQALMELGATVCGVSAPECRQCPWNESCQAHWLGYPQAFPVKPEPKEKIVRRAACAMMLDPQGKFILSRRPVQGIWANLWTLPLSVCDQDQAPAPILSELLSPLFLRLPPVASVTLRHVFTHRIWLIEGYRVLSDHSLSQMRLPPNWVCLAPEEARAYPLPAPMIQLIQKLL
jgi:A/G-specific adenine glycosylase